MLSRPLLLSPLLSPFWLALLSVLGLGVFGGGAGTDGADDPATPVLLSRVTTAVPWPRGLTFVDGELLVLARGRHRRAGGPVAGIEDRAGTLFVVDPDVAEPVLPGDAQPGEAVANNARILAEPTSPPFELWDRVRPPVEDTAMDRPYCTLAYDPTTQNLFVCGFAGVDMTDGTFRKNGTDSVLRFDLRSDRWSTVDRHREVEGTAVQPEDKASWLPNDHYPHHDPADNPPPHGWTNGPNGACVVGRWLYVAAKDNDLVVRYDLSALADDPTAGPPPSLPVLGVSERVAVNGQVVDLDLVGHSALASQPGWLYLGCRTSSQVVRFPLDDDGVLVTPVVGELIARFDPFDEQSGLSADLVDLAFDPDGQLYVSTARHGAIWKIGHPDPARIFDGTSGTSATPFVDLRLLTGNPVARTGNITFDDAGRLFLCAGNYQTGYDVAGVIYRAEVRRP